ncbi:uncharacterized protein LOC111292895 isoform X2 [Durio zibethinus]|uniref:Uncharacterized protein LOC111292895 isoform X2 n=1 Tax=Durio zibethinus TaxID=66656 RepID=A0A6P5YLP6_DURZI|nr:uncharacterized protein LOC111292895 isoform X2 [Durio zibethinus]
MLRRSILELSSRRGSPRRIPRQIISQRSSTFIYSRKRFSTSPGNNATPKPGSAGGPPESKNGFSKVVLGTAIIGGAVLVAYQAGYLDQYLGEGPKVSIDSTKIGFDGKDEKDNQVVSSHNEDINKLTPDQKAATHIDHSSQSETSSETQGENQSNVEDKSNETLGESTRSIPEKALPEYSQSSLPSADHNVDAAVSAEGNLKKIESETATVPNKEFQDIPLDTQSIAFLGEKETKTVPSLNTADRPLGKSNKDLEVPSSLLDTYNLREKADESYLTSLNRKYEQLSKETEAFGTAIEELNDGYLSKDGKLVLDFLQAIHAAEKRQAELDAHAFAEEKRALKEKYEKELRDSRARELMHTEEAAILDKINALCVAFYARSEEACKIHSVHKLALGVLALGDALSKGLPIQKEIDALRTYLEGIEKDSALDLVFSSLPEETRYHGTDTLLELNQKFNALKGTLRHFSLILPGGGGILTHSLAHIASWLKVKEVDQSGEGIESLISRVDNYLAEGKLAEAAAALEQGVKGSQAEEIVGDWVKRVRNRTITEQALTILQSYATCISLT